MILTKAGLFYRTVRHIPILQLAYFAVRRILPVQSRKIIVHGDRSGWSPRDTPIKKALPSPHPELQETGFVFLNEPANFGIKTIDWRSSEKPKLWRYHLHYFDWLKDRSILHSDAAFTIADWIENNPVGSEDAWEPYTVSLRVVNWIKYFYFMGSRNMKIPEPWIVSLELQAEWLARNMEWHIKANHLFKNIVAMVWARAFFRQSSRDRSLQFYISLLDRELGEQFNDDGGHYERAPTYHALCIEDCIDTYNLLDAIDPQFPVLVHLEAVVNKGLRFQKVLSFSDGAIPLMGDSTLHGGHDWKQLLEYWKGVTSREVVGFDDSGITFFKETGFFIFKNEAYEVVFSTGTVSPSYQPGHAHCDVGSFELFMVKDGQRLLVDSGVSQYAAGSMRKYVRSSIAHNILTVDNQDQHEMWGEFRVGARMEVVSCDISSENGDAVIRLTMKSHGVTSVPYRHVRTMFFQRDSILVRDQVDVAKPANIDIRFNVHPDVNVFREAESIAFEYAGKQAAGMRGSGVQSSVFEDSCYCPDFGVVRKSNRLKISALTSSSAEFEFCMFIM